MASKEKRVHFSPQLEVSDEQYDEMPMALTVEKLLNDANTLITRLKDDDYTAERLIGSMQALNNRIDSMKQYQDDITELNEIAKHRPRSTLVLGLAQENRQIRELQQENRELRMSLEEHQSAMELIMKKYRQQIGQLIQSNQVEKLISQQRDDSQEEVLRLLGKIDEMAGVMQSAAKVDDQQVIRDQEWIRQLQLENQTLREILEVSSSPTDNDLHEASNTAVPGPSENRNV